MSAEKQIKRQQASTLDILHALVMENQWLDLVITTDPLQQQLSAVIQKLSAEPDYKRPAIKELASSIGKSPAAVTKCLQQLYQRIWEINEEAPERFQGTGYCYNLHFQDGCHENLFFTLWLEQPLHIGETFDWYFARIRQNSMGYYVEDIRHEYGNGKLSTHVFLKSGSYNSYRHHLLDKAMFLDLITISERYQLMDFQLDELLIHRVEKDRASYPESLNYLRNKKWH